MNSSWHALYAVWIWLRSHDQWRRYHWRLWRSEYSISSGHVGKAHPDPGSMDPGALLGELKQSRRIRCKRQGEAEWRDTTCRSQWLGSGAMAPVCKQDLGKDKNRKKKSTKFYPRLWGFPVKNVEWHAWLAHGSHGFGRTNDHLDK